MMVDWCRTCAVLSWFLGAACFVSGMDPRGDTPNGTLIGSLAFVAAAVYTVGWGVMSRMDRKA